MPRMRSMVAISSRSVVALSTLHHHLSLGDGLQGPRGGDHHNRPKELETEALRDADLPEPDLNGGHHDRAEGEQVDDVPHRVRIPCDGQEMAGKDTDEHHREPGDATVVEDPESPQIGHEAKTEADEDGE